MTDITDIFEDILADARSLDMAESIFKCRLCDEPELKMAYRTWCEQEGTSERMGFIEYCSRRFDEEQALWDNLSDTDYDYE